MNSGGKQINTMFIINIKWILFWGYFFWACLANISPFVITNTENSTITIIFHGWKLAKYETVAVAFLFIQGYFTQMCYCYVLVNGAEQLIFDIKYTFTIPIPVKCKETLKTTIFEKIKLHPCGGGSDSGAVV